MLGLKVLYNDERFTYGRRSNNEMLMFGLHTFGDYIYTSIGEIMAPQVFRYDFVNEKDVIVIEVGSDLKSRNSVLNYEDYVTFSQKIHYEYYQKKINDSIDREIYQNCKNKLGISICLNNRYTNVPLSSNENVNLSVVIQDDKAFLGLGALVKNGNNFKRRIWFNRQDLNIGDILTIEYKEVSNETPFLSEDIALEYTDMNNRQAYQSIRNSLIKKGVISGSQGFLRGI